MGQLIKVEVDGEGEIYASSECDLCGENFFEPERGSPVAINLAEEGPRIYHDRCLSEETRQEMRVARYRHAGRMGWN